MIVINHNYKGTLLITQNNLTLCTVGFYTGSETVLIAWITGKVSSINKNGSMEWISIVDSLTSVFKENVFQFCAPLKKACIQVVFLEAILKNEYTKQCEEENRNTSQMLPILPLQATET